MAGELQRENICKGCPFWIGTPKEAQEPGTPIPMLCHESGCLEGNGPDLICEGWRQQKDLMEL